MKSLVEDTIKSVSADYLEIRIEKTRKLSISYDGRNNLKNVSQVEDSGGYVRALVGGGWGFISFNDTENLKENAKLAVEKARVLKKEKFRMEHVAPYVENIHPDVNGKRDPRKIPFNEKVDYFPLLVKQIMGSHERIINARAGYVEKDRNLIIANSTGTFLNIEDLDVSGGLSVVARKDDVIQSAYQSFGTKNNWESVTDVEKGIPRLITESVKLTEAGAVKGGKYTVILDPRLSGVFIHEAFGHLSEADDVAANPAMMKQMKFGKKMGREILNVCDGGAYPGYRGSYKFDDEGTPSSITHIIRQGILQGRLHSRETAGKMREPATGNARTVSYRFPPICRMSNTFIDAGESTFEEMLEGVDYGIYACGSGSGNTSKGVFTFSAEKGYIIRNGKVEEMVRDVVLTGNVFDTLANIDMVGKDLKHSKGGGCGRSYGQRIQYPLPVSMGSPHVRIQNVLIGGE